MQNKSFNQTQTNYRGHKTTQTWSETNSSGRLCRLQKVIQNPADKLAYNMVPEWKLASGQSSGDPKNGLNWFNGLAYPAMLLPEQRLIQSKTPLCDDAPPQRRTERAENNTNTATCQLNITVNIIIPPQRERWRRQWRKYTLTTRINAREHNGSHTLATLDAWHHLSSKNCG